MSKGRRRAAFIPSKPAPINPRRVEDRLTKRFDKRLEKVWLARTWNSPELLRGGIDYSAIDHGPFCDYFLEKPQKWQIWLGVFQIKDNEYWTDVEVVHTSKKSLARDLADYLGEKLEQMIDGRNPNLIKGTGWYAVPNSVRDLIEETEIIEELFRQHGAFGNMSKGQRINQPRKTA